jgi:hypothetical protein
VPIPFPLPPVLSSRPSGCPSALFIEFGTGLTLNGRRNPMRTLRFLTLVLALSLALPVFAVPAFAGSGKAIIPPTTTFYANANLAHQLITTYSNISDNTIEVTVTLYKEDGTLVYDTAGNSAASGDIIGSYASSGYTEATSSSDGYTFKFELDSKNSCRVEYYPKGLTLNRMYINFGTIEWINKYSTDDDEVALVANAKSYLWYVQSGLMRESKANVPINYGMPF